MSDTEVAFRAALHDEHHATAAVLLAQLVSAHHAQRAPLSFAQDIRLQRYCLDLLSQRSVAGADALLRIAITWVL
ncbi:hypothetical protein K3G63_04125 [Hymenobacter sp. HSC-4F20]|uniref:hypothetical protein n=1 Tax=Hymenobacter sp. HSC-4F20 TaxID=2864135 RepID=UPI001C72E2CE|nr:hypothetical protein [Hymenobacter sp. HSC-4F20]MBX0289610.1 hypothetical protein [Hymenobacter sp. HSC-4F20]